MANWLIRKYLCKPPNLYNPKSMLDRSAFLNKIIIICQIHVDTLIISKEGIFISQKDPRIRRMFCSFRLSLFNSKSYCMQTDTHSQTHRDRHTLPTCPQQSKRHKDFVTPRGGSSEPRQVEASSEFARCWGDAWLAGEKGRTTGMLI